MWRLVVQYKSINVSEEPDAAIFRIKDGGSRLLLDIGTYDQTTRRKIPEDSNLYIHRYVNICIYN
jgi:hypothetical protein